MRYGERRRRHPAWRGRALHKQAFHHRTPRNGISRSGKRLRDDHDLRRAGGRHRGGRPEPHLQFRQVGRSDPQHQRPPFRQGNDDLSLQHDARSGIRGVEAHHAHQPGGRFDRNRLRRHVGRRGCRRADRTADEEFRGGFRDLRHAGRARTDRGALYHLQGSYPHGLFGRGLRSARLFREERLYEGRHRPSMRWGAKTSRRC